MNDYLLPPPKNPSKSTEELSTERKARVQELIKEGYLKSERMVSAMLKVPREAFVPTMYRDYAYDETPLPIPGGATISCPHSYPLFHEALDLKKNDRFLEIGTGSGYGAALAREIIGAKGEVITVEIDRKAYRFAKKNLNRLGYEDIIVVSGDGVSFCQDQEQAIFDKIVFTASSLHIPDSMLERLTSGGRLIIPIGPPEGPQDLMLFERRGSNGQAASHSICQVQYMALVIEKGEGSCS